jgi:hypothetical protein
MEKNRYGNSVKAMVIKYYETVFHHKTNNLDVFIPSIVLILII